MCYLHGNGVEPNLVDAAFWFQLAAKQGHAGAREFLATMSALLP